MSAPRPTAARLPIKLEPAADFSSMECSKGQTAYGGETGWSMRSRIAAEDAVSTIVVNYGQAGVQTYFERLGPRSLFEDSLDYDVPGSWTTGPGARRLRGCPVLRTVRFGAGAVLRILPLWRSCRPHVGVSPSGHWRLLRVRRKRSAGIGRPHQGDDRQDQDAVLLDGGAWRSLIPHVVPRPGLPAVGEAEVAELVAAQAFQVQPLRRAQSAKGREQAGGECRGSSARRRRSRSVQVVQVMGRSSI